MNPGDDPWQTGEGDPWAGQRLPHQQAEEEEQQTSQPSDPAMPSTFTPGPRTRQSPIVGVTQTGGGITPGSMDPPTTKSLTRCATKLGRLQTGQRIGALCQTDERVAGHNANSKDSTRFDYAAKFVWRSQVAHQ